MPIKWVIVLLVLTIVLIGADVIPRLHEESESRKFIARSNSSTQTDYDTVAVENYLRNYRQGSSNNLLMLYNHDLIAAYVGPAPADHPDALEGNKKTKGMVRMWAMFDSRTWKFCQLAAIHNYGELALFSCNEEGLYRAYAIDCNITDSLVTPEVHKLYSKGKHLLRWSTLNELEMFNLLFGKDARIPVFAIKNVVPGAPTRIPSSDNRMKALDSWHHLKPYEYIDSSGNTIETDTQPVVVSDPIRVKESYYCYYWMYHVKEVSRDGYTGKELIPFVEDPDPNKKKDAWTASITLEILIWIGEPAAVEVDETSDTTTSIIVSEYSKVITKRYAESGLFPCLRKAHSAVEVIQDTIWNSGIERTLYLPETPHWKLILKIHTDRLVSTLSDITFTIAGRQNAASFNCFVGDTRVFIQLRDFQFVPMRKLQPGMQRIRITLNL